MLKKWLLRDIYDRLAKLEATQDEQDDVLIEVSKLAFNLEECTDDQDDAIIEMSKAIYGGEQ